MAAALGNTSSNNTGAGGFNETGANNSKMAEQNNFKIAAGFSLLISILGIIGNNLVIWYLFLIYLIFFSILMCIILISFSDQGPDTKYINALEIIIDFGMYADMFLLMAISMERCLSVVYPVWYRCKRPQPQSVLVCVFLWGVSLLVALVDQLGCPSELFNIVEVRCTTVQTFLAVITFLVTIPIMVVSSLILIIRVHKTLKQHQPPKLFIVIVASVIIFLISVAPVRLLWLLLYLKVLPYRLFARVLFYVSYLWVSIHSTMNPFIYFLVGRHKMQGVQEYIFRALKKVFREEEEEEEENGARAKRCHELGNATHSNVS